ncbi:MAG: LPXTG cell wall anchor domain-containing protein [Oscillospiraceae bacterium]|nr:LPXTG cell wall anchor domain-containing protein [Oscillospiraceae bacterium]
MKKLNKLLAIVLAIAMIMSLTVAAGATGTASITISNASDGETYSAWKIFDATEVAGSSPAQYTYTISTSSAFYSAISTAVAAGGTLNSYLTLTQSAADSTVYVVEYIGTTGNEDAFTAALATVIEGVLSGANAPSADKTAVATSGTATMSDLDAGYYYVSTTVGTVVVLDTTNIAINDKNSKPSADKQVSDDGTTYADSNSAAVGDTVYFKTTVSGIYGSTSLRLHDLMDAGLTFSGITSVVLYTSDSAQTGTTLTSGASGQGYTLYTNASDPDAFYLIDTSEYTWNTTDYYYLDSGTYTLDTVGNNSGDFDSTKTYYIKSTFDMTFDYSDVTGIEKTGYIVVTYTATVNSNAVIYSTTGDSNDNETYVSFGATSYSEPQNTQTYVYKMNIFKYTGTLDASSTTLAGAVFEIYRYTDNTQTTKEYAIVDTNNVITSWTQTESEASKFTSTDGSLITVSGFDANETYYIHETSAPTGYNPLSGDVPFTIDDGTNSTQGYVTYDTNSQNTTTLTAFSSVTAQTIVPIENKTGSEMPETGGIGTTIFYIVGGVLVVGAIVLLITKKRIGKDGE